jgi:hypothetical protein
VGARGLLAVAAAAGSQFTCFTGTKVQILTQLPHTCRRCRASSWRLPPATGTQFTCFTGTKVQILTPEYVRIYSINSISSGRTSSLFRLIDIETRPAYVSTRQHTSAYSISSVRTSSFLWLIDIETYLNVCVCVCVCVCVQNTHINSFQVFSCSGSTEWKKCNNNVVRINLIIIWFTSLAYTACHLPHKKMCESLTSSGCMVNLEYVSRLSPLSILLPLPSSSSFVQTNRF